MRLRCYSILWFKLILLVCAVSLTSHAQTSHSDLNNSIPLEKQIAFRSITVEEGLSQNSVVSITQDSIGYLWLATQDGLNRYDGTTFKYYKKQFEDVTNPTFSRLGKTYIDKENTLWIISKSGNLEKYNATNDNFNKIDAFQSVSSIYQDYALNIYVGTYDNGLYKIDYKTKDTLQLFKNEDFNKTVYELTEENNKLVVACANGVLTFEKDDSYSIIFSTDKTTHFSSLSKVKNNQVWVGSFGKGLFSLDIESQELLQFKGFTNSTLPAHLNIQYLLVDKQERLWIATYGNGVYLLDFNSETIQHFTAQKYDSQSISYNDVLSLFEDYTGTIWLGTDGGGASYYDEHLSKFNVLTNNNTPQNINIDVIRAIAVDDKHNVWLGTSGKGLTFISADKNTYKTYTKENHALSSNRIMSLLADNESLWIGHQGQGLNILNGNDEIDTFNERTTIKLPATTIWCIFKDSKQQIWLGSRHSGLLQFDKNIGVINQYLHKENDVNSMSSNNIRTVTEGENGILWIGTDDNGLNVLNTNTNTINRIPEIKDNIKSLYFDGIETLWIGTNGNGLKSYNTATKEVNTFSTEIGLPNNVIYGILPDQENNLWLSSNKGLTKFNLANFNITNYSNYDGLQAFEFNTGAYAKDINNTLYFGGLEGLNWFDPNQLSINPSKPKTIISKFEVYAKPQALIQNKNYSYNQNTVTFTFSSLHFSQPERNLYKYRLVNHDLDWIDSGNVNTAHYTNLPPDDYTFEVISSNYDGVWNSTPTTYTFTIKQPWYLSTLAIICYSIGLLIGFYLIYNYLKWRWQVKMQLQLEHAETERLKQLDEYKTKLYTNISHEFRTPLTLISGPIEKQLAKSDLTQKDKKELNLVQQNSKRLLNLVNQLLDLSKLETGNFKLSVSKGNLSVLLKQLVAAFQYKAQSKNINFTSKLQHIDEAWFDKEIIEKIITNLLSNAVKYTPENGNIHFSTTKNKGQIIISVINNGNTIVSDDLSKLFQRYYQNNKNTDGTGIGLSLVKELAILSHGNVVANTMNEDDIQFTVTLPIERSFYNTSEINETTLKFKALKDEKKSEISNIKTHTASKNKPLLLIIEDDEDIRHFIASVFESDYKILQASNGKQGISIAISQIPDIIISDIMMPVTDGIMLCNTLKNDERTSHIPIILLTAKSGDQNEIKGLKTGADAYITKPFNTEKLKIQVANLIALRQQLQQKYNQSLDLNDLATSPIEELFLTKLKEELSSQITNPEFNAAKLSKALHISRMQLHRKLKALTGLTTTEFIRTERLKLALPLLKERKLTISEIAYQIGFNTPSYFIKCFKESYNSTPLTFR